MHTALHHDDKAYLALLKPHYATLGVPKYGSTASYTKAVGLFVDSWNPVPTAQIPHRIESAVSGNSVANWAYNAADSKHKNDAELGLLTRVEANTPLNGASDGTLYIVQSKGPCRSCKRVISQTFQNYYSDVRVVLWYAEKCHHSHDGMMYGYEHPAQVLGGYAVVYEARSTRNMAAPG
jgi:hypothetical protein